MSKCTKVGAVVALLVSGAAQAQTVADRVAADAVQQYHF
jgi:hypothetical protein